MFFSVRTATVRRRAAVLLWVALAFSTSLAAQPAAPVGPRDPIDARAAVPPVSYRSALSSYRPLGDDKTDWKEANHRVGRIGGWRAYAREANAPEVPASAPDAGAAHRHH